MVSFNAIRSVAPETHWVSSQWESWKRACALAAPAPTDQQGNWKQFVRCRGYEPQKYYSKLTSRDAQEKNTGMVVQTCNPSSKEAKGTL